MGSAPPQDAPGQDVHGHDVPASAEEQALMAQLRDVQGAFEAQYAARRQAVAERDAARAEARDLARRLEAAETRLGAVTGSRSWRMLAPLRALAARLGASP